MGECYGNEKKTTIIISTQYTWSGISNARLDNDKKRYTQTANVCGVELMGLGSFYQNIIGKVLGRKGYKAFAGGKIVTGCFECRHNIGIHVRGFPTAHQCEVSIDNFCKPLRILDPYDVPELCAMRVREDGPNIPTLIAAEEYRETHKDRVDWEQGVNGV